jgi:LPXTG-motif cell wall-anchored protein
MKNKNLVLGIVAGAAVISTAAFLLTRRRKQNENQEGVQSSMPSRGERLAAKARHKAQHHFAKTV